jgi:hypothetical protein
MTQVPASWTKDIPKEEGFYWWRYGDGEGHPRIVRVYFTSIMVRVAYFGSDHVDPAGSVNGQFWTERIQAPKDVPVQDSTSAALDNLLRFEVEQCKRYLTSVGIPEMGSLLDRIKMLQHERHLAEEKATEGRL